MGSLLCPVVANIVMTELESTIVKELFDQLLVKLYMRYVRDTLLLVKGKGIDLVQKRLIFQEKHSIECGVLKMES